MLVLADEQVSGQITLGHQRLVQRHLLEVRAPPRLIERVPEEPPAKVVSQPAASHAAQSGLDHLDTFLRRRRTGLLCRPMMGQEFEAGWRREFWDAAEPAVDWIELSGDPG